EGDAVPGALLPDPGTVGDGLPRLTPRRQNPARPLVAPGSCVSDPRGKERVLGNPDAGFGKSPFGVRRGVRLSGGGVTAGRDHRVDDGARIDVHQVEPLRAVVPAL